MLVWYHETLATSTALKNCFIICL